MPRRHWRLSLTDFPLLFLYHISYIQSVLLTVEMALGKKWILQQHSQITKYLNHSQAQMTNLQFLCNNLGSCRGFFPELGTGTANCVKRFRARNLGFWGFGVLVGWGFFTQQWSVKKIPWQFVLRHPLEMVGILQGGKKICKKAIPLLEC